MTAAPHLISDPETARAARLFLASVRRCYPVRGALRYGSRARGNFRIDSDADVAVLLETGIHSQPLPLRAAPWEHPESFSNPRLIENIRREGIVVLPQLGGPDGLHAAKL